MQDDEALERAEMKDRGMVPLWVMPGAVIHINGVPFESAGGKVYGTPGNAALVAHDTLTWFDPKDHER